MPWVLPPGVTRPATASMDSTWTMTPSRSLRILFAGATLPTCRYRGLPPPRCPRTPRCTETRLVRQSIRQRLSSLQTLNGRQTVSGDHQVTGPTPVRRAWGDHSLLAPMDRMWGDRRLVHTVETTWAGRRQAHSLGRVRTCRVALALARDNRPAAQGELPN